MYDVARGGDMNYVHSKDVQKQWARASLWSPVLIMAKRLTSFSTPDLHFFVKSAEAEDSLPLKAVENGFVMLLCM